MTICVFCFLLAIDETFAVHDTGLFLVEAASFEIFPSVNSAVDDGNAYPHSELPALPCEVSADNQYSFIQSGANNPILGDEFYSG